MPTQMNGITVCVNYSDLLEITLRRNMRHLSRCVVVTSPEDANTLAVVDSVPNCTAYVTDAFKRHGAAFNKGLALEEGFEFLGRQGVICSWDADIVFPDSFPVPDVQPGKLYSAPRRILEHPSRFREGLHWSRYPLSREQVMPGYLHIFHAEDPVLQELPWGDVTFSHAGGSDGFFQSRWSTENKIWLPFDVLHLGPRDRNWFGRASQLVNGQRAPGAEEANRQIEEFHLAKGWKIRGRKNPAYVERVEVPGNKPREWIHGR